MKTKRTKIVCTLGPATSDEKTLKALVKAGMNVARLNFSHGTHESHLELIKTVRKIAQQEQKPIAILQDLCGPKIRLGNFDGEFIIEKDQIFKLSGAQEFKTEPTLTLPLDFVELAQFVTKGERIFLNDGKLAAVVQSIKKKEVTIKALNQAELSAKKGINLPDGGSKDIPPLTIKDKEDLRFGLEHGVDWVALSFVKSAENIRELKTIIDYLGHDTPIIAKIEKKEALIDLENIISAADGIMVARGDLGVESSLETVTLCQKQIIKKCNQHGKPVIVATQMLESMVSSPLPTRAEVADVTNAILDGTDAIMLSQETSVGQYPVETVEMMTKIAVETEESINYIEILKKEICFRENDITDAISLAAVQIAQKIRAKGLICCTMKGNTARIMTRYKPYSYIIALTPCERTYHQLALSWGTIPVFIKEFTEINEMLAVIDKVCKSLKVVEKGDPIVITAGLPYQLSGATNLIKVKMI